MAVLGLLRKVVKNGQNVTFVLDHYARAKKEVDGQELRLLPPTSHSRLIIVQDYPVLSN